MAVHKMLGHKFIIGDKMARIQFLRGETDHGIATAFAGKNGGEDFHYPVRLSDCSVVRPVKRTEDFDQVILAAGKELAAK